MIKLKTNSKKFITFMNLIKIYCDNVTLKFTKDSLKCMVTDYAAISMISLEFKPSFFEEYDIEEDIRCTVDTETFYKIIKKLGKKEIIFIPSATDLQINNVNDKMTISLMSDSMNDRDIPEISLLNSFTVPTSSFFDTLVDYMEFTKICNFNIEDNNLFMNLKNMHMKGTISIEGTCNVVNDVKTSFYDAEYINMLNPLKTVFDSFTIKFGADTPCKIEQSTDELNFTWILAPRCE